MRSDHIHVAIAQGNSRYEICRLASKGVKITHKSGERTADSINRVLGMLRPPAPAATA
ncbi:MAG TPA: DNA-directed RNA polymerase subunit omega [Acidobacteriaceae bacterium]